jgi:hypothetical protein
LRAVGTSPGNAHRWARGRHLLEILTVGQRCPLRQL